jgi:hypothetical protein
MAYDGHPPGRHIICPNEGAFRGCLTLIPHVKHVRAPSRHPLHEGAHPRRHPLLKGLRCKGTARPLRSILLLIRQKMFDRREYLHSRHRNAPRNASRPIKDIIFWDVTFVAVAVFIFPPPFTTLPVMHVTIPLRTFTTFSSLVFPSHCLYSHRNSSDPNALLVPQ